MPSALAVLRLMISSIFVDCWTGRVGRLFPFENTSGVNAGETVSGRGESAAKAQSSVLISLLMLLKILVRHCYEDENSSEGHHESERAGNAIPLL